MHAVLVNRETLKEKARRVRARKRKHTMEESHDLLMLEKTGFLRTGFAEIADQRSRRMMSRAIGVNEAGLHIEVGRMAEPIL